MYVSKASPGTRGGVAAFVIAAHVAVIYAIVVLLGVVRAPLVEQLTPARLIMQQIEPVEAPPLPKTVEPSKTAPLVVDEPVLPIIEPSEIDTESLASAITVAPVAEPVAEPAPATALAVTRRVDPLYPPVSRRLDESGIVQLKVLVDERGRPREVQVARSSGFDRLDDAAVDAVRRWHFEPATSGSQPVPAWTNVRVVFQLNR